jgi:hypothetical protein
MKEINLKDLLIPIILRRAEEKKIAPLPSLFLTIPDHLPLFYWHDSNLAQLIRAFVERSISFGREEMPIQLTASRRAQMADLEELLGCHPTCWIQLGVEVRSSVDVLGEIRMLPERFGFGYSDEWQADRSCMVIAYSVQMDATPLFFLVFHKSRADYKYNLMIPIVDQRIKA